MSVFTDCRCSQSFCPDLSIYVCLSADFHRCKPPCNRLTPLIRSPRTAIYKFVIELNWIKYQQIACDLTTGVGYVIYFPAQCAVSLICLSSIIYPPPWRYVADIGVWDLAAPARKTTDLLRCLRKVHLFILQITLSKVNRFWWFLVC